MFDRFTRLLQPKDRFRIPATKRELPSCEVRLLQDADFAACEAIYRLNEPGRFPDGYFPRFSDWLRNRRALILVAESEGEIRGLGGINAEERVGKQFAALSFGMVHPAHQRAGFGTTLLLARLALLDDPGNGRSTVMLSTVGGSETFYGRFGFRYLQTFPDPGGYEGDTYIAKLVSTDRKRCLSVLRHARVSPALLNASVPAFASLSLTSAEPLQDREVQPSS